ncbi:hypothetical protein ON010_g5261 [Phytophthora cinnamomi]|nr:hypothetical protein ON010_g5261 [Phytophthora cinnamomi]
MTATMNLAYNEKQAEHNAKLMTSQKFTAASLVNRSRSSRSSSFLIYLWQYTTAKLPGASPTPPASCRGGFGRRLFPADASCVVHIASDTFSAPSSLGLTCLVDVHENPQHLGARRLRHHLLSQSHGERVLNKDLDLGLIFLEFAFLLVVSASVFGLAAHGDAIQQALLEGVRRSVLVEGPVITVPSDGSS